MDLAGLDAVGRTLEAEDELGGGEDAAQGHFDAALEAALRAPVGVEVHERRELLAVDGVAVCARRQRLDDLPRARRFLALRGGPTDEDSLPCRRVADADNVERPGHAHAREVRHERPIGVAVDGRLEEAELERLDHVLDRSVILLDERSADRMRARFDRHADRGADFDLVVRELGEQDALPVERYLELLGLA